MVKSGYKFHQAKKNTIFDFKRLRKPANFVKYTHISGIEY